MAQLYGLIQPSTTCSAFEAKVPAKIPKNEFSQKIQTWYLGSILLLNIYCACADYIMKSFSSKTLLGGGNFDPLTQENNILN